MNDRGSQGAANDYELAKMEQDRDLTKAQLDHANDRIKELEREREQLQLGGLDLMAQLQAAQEKVKDRDDYIRAEVGRLVAEIERLRGALREVIDATWAIDGGDDDPMPTHEQTQRLGRALAEGLSALTPEGTHE